MTSEPTGWFAEFDDDESPQAPWHPCIQLDGGIAPTLDVWFETEAACVKFIRDELANAGMYPEPLRRLTNDQ